MASSDPVAPIRRVVRIGDIEANRPVSQTVMQKIVGNSNYSLLRTYYDMNFTMDGFVEANNFSSGLGGIKYVENESEVSVYTLALRKSGISGTTEFNVAVYDNTGAFINNLFGAGANALTISGNNGDRVVVGRKGLATDETPANILINTGGHIVQTGVLNFSTLPAGSILVPFLVTNANSVFNVELALRLKEV